MKTEITKKLEYDIWKATHKQGIFCCFEVTIGWYGKERVDYLTYDTKGIWRCYEIKSSKADFYSKCKKTFIGHYNYYVLTKDLYDIVKDDIPKEIGVYVGETCVKKSRKQDLKMDNDILKDSFIRSLHRESEKLYKSNQECIITNYQRQINRLEREKQDYNRKYYELLREVQQKYGINWRRK